MDIDFANLQLQYQKYKVDIDSNIQAVLNKSNYILGEEVHNLERVLEKFTGVKHAITCSSGTDALLLAMMALDIQPGEVRETPQNEKTPFHPKSPYAVAKMYAYWITVNYRESYGMYACNGILFNHESPRRGETFVTRKITRGLANISQGLENCLYMGNINALRDWGHAKDYVRMQWMMLQQETPEDFCIATGWQYSVRQFINWSAKELGITLRFEGEGLDELGVIESIKGDDSSTLKEGDTIVRIDKRFFRPAEVETLLGDPSKAKEKLGWTPEITVQEICKEMIENDLKEAKKNILLKNNNFPVNISKEW